MIAQAMSAIACVGQTFLYEHNKIHDLDSSAFRKFLREDDSILQSPLGGLSLRRVGGLVRATDLRCMGKREQNICHYTPDCKELSKD